MWVSKKVLSLKWENCTGIIDAGLRECCLWPWTGHVITSQVFGSRRVRVWTGEVGFFIANIFSCQMRRQSAECSRQSQKSSRTAELRGMEARWVRSEGHWSAAVVLRQMLLL